MDVNQVTVYGFALTLALFAVMAWNAHRNLRVVLKGLKDINERAVKLDKNVTGMTDEVRQVRASLTKKVEHKSLDRIFAETLGFIERNSPSVAVATNRVQRR